MDRENERIGLQEIIDKAIEEVAREAGDSFEIDRMNLADFSRRTGLSRSKARSLKAKGFVATPHGRCGMKAEITVKNYIAAHADLVPAKRKLAKADPQASRGRRFETGSSEARQMDWALPVITGKAQSTSMWLLGTGGTLSDRPNALCHSRCNLGEVV